MNIESNSKLFPLAEPSLELVKELAGKTAEAECAFFRPAAGKLTEMEIEGEQETVVLQVVEEHILQRATSGAVLACFKCDYEIQFEILRKPSQVRPVLRRFPTALASPRASASSSRPAKITPSNWG